MNNQEQQATPKFAWALTLVVVLMFIFGFGIIGLKLSPVVPLLVALATVTGFAKMRRTSWNTIQSEMLAGIQTALAPLFLFLLIGALIGLWMATNVIPSLLWVGFKLANVTWFLPTTLLISGLVGSMIGSAFTTMSTVGIALMGVGTAMGFNPALVAGAVISGAIFGDKNSPLSESTNLAASIAESDLFAHIRNLMWSTIPAVTVSLLLFTLIGFGHSHGSVANLQHLSSLLSPTWWAALPIALLIGMVWMKISAIPTLLANVTVTSILFLTNHNATQLESTIINGFKTTSSNTLLQGLLNRGGMMSMMSTVIIIMLALALGGLLTEQKILHSVMEPIITRLSHPGSVVTGTLLTGIFANFMIGEQFLATILPGQLWKRAFDDKGLARLALGRSLEDSGTVMNYLVPWGVAGSFAAQTLGVPVSHFAPFVFFALFSPVFSLISAWTGIGLKFAKQPERTKRSIATVTLTPKMQTIVNE